MRSFQRTLLRGGLVFFLLLGLASVFLSAYIVREGEVAYVTQFGAITDAKTEAGLYFRLPFIQDVTHLSQKERIYDVHPSEVLTADKKAMIVDSYAIWNIDDVKTFYSSVGNETEMQKRIDASVYSVIKNLMGGLEQEEIITDKETSRSDLNEEITKQVREQLKGYGVRVNRVEIKRYDLPKDNLEAVYHRMVSERKQMAAAYKAEGAYEAARIRNETDKEIQVLLGEARAQAERLKGEGEEAYMKTLETAYGEPARAEFYLFLRELEALKASLKGEEKVLVLGKDSKLAQILNGSGLGGR